MPERSPLSSTDIIAFSLAILFVIIAVLVWFYIFRSLCGYHRGRTSRPMTVPMMQDQSQPYAYPYGNQYAGQYRNTQFRNTQDNNLYGHAGFRGNQPPQQPPQAYTGDGQNQYYPPRPGQPPSEEVKKDAGGLYTDPAEMKG